MKIIGYTVGTTTPKPSFRQDDPTKGDYIKDKEALDDRYYTEEEIDEKVENILSTTQDKIDKKVSVSFDEDNNTLIFHI